MTDRAHFASESEAPIPTDDRTRTLAMAHPDDRSMRFVSIAGGTYTILLSGDQTGGRYCLIDMHVPPGGGPPPHRHDFEEMFTVLEGNIEVTFRGERALASAGTTVNIPANGHTHSEMCRTRRPGSYACARRPGRRSSSRQSATRSRVAPPLLQR